MSKYLALGLIVLGLVSCASGERFSPRYAETPLDNKLIAVGHGQDVEWKCVQDQADLHVVFIDCQFHKFSNTVDKRETCVRLNYYQEPGDTFVASSRLVCSDMMKNYESTNHYVVFQKFQRMEMLVACGDDNSQCKLVLREEARPVAK